MADRKWGKGSSYGPVLTQTELYLLEDTELHIHPILAQKFDAFQLEFNLQTGQTLGFSVKDRNTALEFIKKDEAATLPRLTQLAIISRHSPWVTYVQNNDGVTLANICERLWLEYSRTPLTEQEFKMLSVREKERVKRMALLRENNGQYGSTRSALNEIPVERCRRIDWLGGKTLFDGLEKDDKFVKSRLGFAAPNILVLSLTNGY